MGMAKPGFADYVILTENSIILKFCDVAFCQSTLTSWYYYYYNVPLSSSISTIFAWPLHAAECNGVSPSLF